MVEVAAVTCWQTRMRILLVVAAIELLSTTAVPAADAVADPVDSLQYKAAFSSVVRGDYLGAHDHFDRLIDSYPDSPYTHRARDRSQRLQRMGLSRTRLRLDQSGRVSTLLFGTLYGTWLGVGAAIAADYASDKSLAGGMMLGAPAGFLSTRLLTSNRAISAGQGSLIRDAGIWGSWQGFGWMVSGSGSQSRRQLATSTMAGGLLSLAGAGALSRRTDVSRGDAALLRYAALWGSWFAFGHAVMSIDDDSQLTLRRTLIGGNIGLATMAAIAPRVEISHTRARMINLGGVIGTFGMAGAVGLMALNGAFDGPGPPMGMILTGGIAGLWIGTRTTAGEP